jgi:hypothetical protein
MSSTASKVAVLGGGSKHHFSPSFSTLFIILFIYLFIYLFGF